MMPLLGQDGSKLILTPQVAVCCNYSGHIIHIVSYIIAPVFLWLQPSVLINLSLNVT